MGKSTFFCTFLVAAFAGAFTERFIAGRPLQKEVAQLKQELDDARHSGSPADLWALPPGEYMVLKHNLDGSVSPPPAFAHHRYILVLRHGDIVESEIRLVAIGNKDLPSYFSKEDHGPGSSAISPIKESDVNWPVQRGK